MPRAYRIYGRWEMITHWPTGVAAPGAGHTGAILISGGKTVAMLCDAGGGCDSPRLTKKAVELAEKGRRYTRPDNMFSERIYR